MLNFKNRLLSAASVCAWATVAIATAHAQTLGPVKSIAPNDPFTSCVADNVHGQSVLTGGTEYPGAVVEPWLAISPTNARDQLIGVQQDRWSNGGSRGLRGNYSYDGGLTWHSTMTPDVTLCQSGPWQRASDPWIDYSSDGKVAYFSELVVDESSNPNALAALSGQTVSTSQDGGATWQPPTTLIIDNNINILNDKNAVTADGRDANAAYVVWDRLQQYAAGAGVADEGENSGSTNAAIQAVRGAHGASEIAHALKHLGELAATGAANPVTFPLLVTGPTLFSRTLDKGRTWSLPKVIWNPGNNSQTIANQVVNLPNGDIADYFTELQDNTAGQPSRIGYVESSDHGATWSTANYAQQIVNQQAVTPNLREPIRSADVLFSVAVDRLNGLIYLVWEDQRFSGVNEVAFAWSPDNGQQWTAPVRINQTPRNPLHPLFQQGLIPSVTKLADGTVGVTYYDFRNDKVGAKTDLADYWLITCNPVTSSDNCLSTGDWTHETRVTGTSFDYDLAPVAAPGHFIGDYMGLRGIGKVFYSVHGESRSKNVSSQFFRSITLPTVTASAK